MNKRNAVRRGGGTELAPLLLLIGKFLLFAFGVYLTIPFVRLTTAVTGDWSYEIAYSIRVLELVAYYDKELRLN